MNISKPEVTKDQNEVSKIISKQPNEEDENNQDEEQEQEEDDDEEEEEYAEAEPVLTYSRMKNDVNDILSNDSVSCIRAGHKILVLGTHYGRIHIMDHDGNKFMTRENHLTTVNDVTIDSKEEFVATCSDDGKVTIFGLCEATYDQVIEFSRPIKSVELEPNFLQTLSFITGDTKLVMNEKGFMGRRKTQIIHEGEGIIRNIKWLNDLIAWSNDKGVKIYSISEKRIITFITKDHDPNLRDEIYRCSLLWLDENTLVIGWADRFKICKIVRRHTLGVIPSTSGNSKASKALGATLGALGATSIGSNFVATIDKKDLGTHVEIISMLQTDFYTCGIAPFKERFQFLLLCYEKAQNASKTESDSRPHIRVIQAHPDSFEEISFDAVTIKDYEKNLPLHYRLDFILEDGLYFILSPKDIIKAMPRSIDDRIKWFMERFEFELAFSVIEKAPPNSIKIYTHQVVAMNYIDYLVMSKQYKSAAEWCSKIKMSVKTWEEKILIFAKEGKLDEIYDRIPVSPTLSAMIYEQVLNEFLRAKNFKIFNYLIKKWPCDIYDMKCVTNAVLDVQRRNDDKILMQSMAILLIALNKEKAIAILVDNIEKLPIKKVVEQLSKNKLYLHYYLDSIFDKDPNLSRDFHTMQVVLYADYQPDKLLYFLQNSQYIILAQAQKELQERNLVPEIVYILERMGQTKKALQLVLHAIKDVNQAIVFCKKHNDKDLWEDLIKYSLNKPEYIIGLLNNIDTHVDPVDLIDRIPYGVKIKGLRDALVKILSDYRVQISLLDGSKNIMYGDCLNLMEKQIRVVRQGISIEENQKCLVCEGSLIFSNVNMLRRLKIFECKHAYHEECIQQSGACIVCSQSKTKHFGLNSAE